MRAYCARVRCCCARATADVPADCARVSIVVRERQHTYMNASEGLDPPPLLALTTVAAAAKMLKRNEKRASMMKE